MSTFDQKLEQFNAFFLISHGINTNVTPLEDAQLEHDRQAFEANMPYAFRIAAEMSEIQSKSLKPLRNLEEKLDDLVDYLQFQAKKIDLMMSYILQQQDEEQHRLKAAKFGGGGVVIQHPSKVDVGERKALKLFLESESAAIYCYGEAIICEQQDDAYHVSYIYTHIREQDQELLVRASLHLQTHALRAQHKNK